MALDAHDVVEGGPIQHMFIARNISGEGLHEIPPQLCSTAGVGRKPYGLNGLSWDQRSGDLASSAG